MHIYFDSVWGQDAVCSILAQNIARNRIAGSYLFSGPRGTGKTKVARIFAEALLCSGKGEKRPCGECRSCKMFRAATHPDFISLLPDGAQIKVEQIRAAMAALSLKSYQGGKKVCVVDEADAMNRATANAFLKTLEEPPPETVIILVSSNPSALLPTIISRCRGMRFTPMRPEALAEKLEKHLSIPPEEAMTMSFLAEGSPGKALGEEMEHIKRIDMEADSLLAGILNMTPDGVIRFAENYKKRDRGDLSIMIDRLMDKLRLTARPHTSPPSATIKDYMNTLRVVPEERLVAGFETLLSLTQWLTFNPNIQLFLEAAIFNLQSILKEGVPLADSSD